MSILGFLFLIIIIILIFGVSIISNVLRLFFGFGRKTGHGSTMNNNQDSRQQQSDSYSRKTQEKATKSNNNKKIFGKDEGEYIEFEEIKED